MNKRLYMRRWLLALDRYELSLRVKVARERNRFVKEASLRYDNGSIPSHLVVLHTANLKALLLEHYQQVMPYFGKMTTKELKARHRHIERKADRSAFLGRITEWAATRALQSALRITDTDRSDIIAIIEDGLTEGLGNAEIARSITRATDLTSYRAATIARTETHAAATYGAIEEARQTSEEIGIVLVKEWLPTTDARTRPAHLAMLNAEPIGLDELFEVDGELLDRPGDPGGSAENIINCRCAIAMVEKD